MLQKSKMTENLLSSYNLGLLFSLLSRPPVARRNNHINQYDNIQDVFVSDVESGFPKRS